MSSERAREREVLRYYHSWLESFNARSQADKDYLSDPYRNNGSSVKSSRDKSLVSFAQLGCLRLNVKRGLVTLISSSQQFVIAESTKTTSLISDAGFAKNDELWFGEASLPRSQGISGNALDPPSYSTQDKLGNPYTAPAFVVNDIETDDRFSHLQYSGRGVNFYAGVPLLSRSGFAVGAFTVTDTKARAGILAEELRFLQDMAIVVMDHLDVIRNNAARYRGERMVEGLSSFVQGLPSIDETDSANNQSINDSLTTPTSPNSGIGDIRGVFKGITVSDTNVRTIYQTRDNLDDNDKAVQKSTSENILTSIANVADSSRVSAKENFTSNDPVLDNVQAEFSTSAQELPVPSEMRQIFARAANIMRQATNADGVVFHDASSFNRLTRVGSTLQGPYQSDTTNSDDSLAKFSSVEDLHGCPTSPSRRSSSGSDEMHQSSGPSARSQRPVCPILGFSFQNSSVTKSKSLSIDRLALTEENLRRLIKRYPRGKVFHYTQDGEVSSSEGDVPPSNRLRISKSTEKKASGRSIAEELLMIVPGARNVVFLPLWDFSKEKWNAGCFVWSGRPEKLLTAQDDLSYLKAFSHSIMSEVTRADISIADRTKTTFIANVSHELRSPLHGIIGCLDVLVQNTSFDTFQSAMISTVETCANTLLSTFDHVLDYAKINQLSKMSQKRRRLERHRKSFHAAVDRTDVLTAEFDLAAIVEEAVEAAYAGQIFKPTVSFHDVIHDLNRKSRSTSSRDYSSVQKTSARDHQLERQLVADKSREPITVIVDIKHLENWVVCAQSGAIRRVVMNLVGNALKYTERGFVYILLSPRIAGLDEYSRLDFCITVKDCGQGMSSEFVNHYAFKAFSQEDSFSSGTGLGLSIVRQIVDDLPSGKIELESEKDVGTEVKVSLKLPAGQTNLDLEPPLSDIALLSRSTHGRTLCLVPLRKDLGQVSPHQYTDKEATKYLEASILAIARDWFGMQIIERDSVHASKVDFIIFTEPPLSGTADRIADNWSGTTGIPTIVLARSPLHAALIESELLQNQPKLGRSIHVISQPFGPHKFGNLLRRILEDQGSWSGSEESFVLDTTAAPRDEGQQYPGCAEADEAAFSFQETPAGSVGLVQDVFQESEEPPSEGLPSCRTSAANDNGHGLSEPPESKTKPKRQPRRTSFRRVSYTSSDVSSDIASSQEPKVPVLIVDDNEINLKLLVEFMRRCKFPYEQAMDGQQAVDVYKRASTDPTKAFKFICMDISMPVKDGLQATREIRAFEKGNKIQAAQIIALTALASEEAQEEAFQSGVNDYLRKPVRFKELMSLLEP